MTASNHIQAPDLGKVSDPQLLDVRTPAEFEDTHIDGSHLLPLDQVDSGQVQALFDTEQPIYVVCGSGKRAGMAVEKLRSAGLECAVVLEGGVGAWENHGLPVNRGRKTISIERQVRIAAGALVALGVGLSLLHSAFLILPAFIGAGLVFAGITDSCGMGLVMAKMPWNQAKQPAANPAAASACATTGSGGGG